jgi:putative addiction module component (TIGR02574 family)
MSGEARKLLKAALRLPSRERAAFAGTLILSLDPKVDKDAEVAWEAEITRRVRDLDAGKAKMVSWSKVRKELYRNLR